MSRPTHGSGPKLAANIRLDPEILSDLNMIVNAAYSNRSIIAQEIILLGIPQFLKREHDINKRYEALKSEKVKKRHSG